jgi:hypothetical protein
MKNRVHPVSNTNRFKKEQTIRKYEEHVMILPLFAILFILFAL